MLKKGACSEDLAELWAYLKKHYDHAAADASVSLGMGRRARTILLQRDPADTTVWRKHAAELQERPCISARALEFDEHAGFIQATHGGSSPLVLMFLGCSSMVYVDSQYLAVSSGDSLTVNPGQTFGFVGLRKASADHFCIVVHLAESAEDEKEDTSPDVVYSRVVRFQRPQEDTQGALLGLPRDLQMLVVERMDSSIGRFAQASTSCHALARCCDSYYLHMALQLARGAESPLRGPSALGGCSERPRETTFIMGCGRSGKQKYECLVNSGDQYDAAVVSMGSRNSSVGLAGDDAPRSVLPMQDYQYGEWKAEGAAVDAFLEQMAFDRLGRNPGETPLLWTEAPLNPKKNRERFTEMAFEVLRVPAAYIALGPVLSLYASGRTTGLVCSLGHDSASFVPVYEGYAVPTGVSIHRDCAGKHLTETLQRLSYPTKSFQEVEKIKESGAYQLPDGRTLLDELFQPGDSFNCAEAICGPINAGFVGFEDIGSELLGNVLLAGGCSLLEGLPGRLESEIGARVPAGTRVGLVCPPERAYSEWIGGSILASLSTFQKMWISREEYDESGPGIVHRKCF